MEEFESEARILIRAQVQSIPGDPLARPVTLGQIFCQTQLERDLVLDDENPTFDVPHVPPQFDSNDNISVWFMFDLGVRRQKPIARAELSKVPLEAYFACHDEEGKWCVFLIVLIWQMY